MPLGDFLDEQLARIREAERVEIPYDHFLDKESTLAILNWNTREEALAFIAVIKEKSLRERMKCDPKFATSPIFITNKDYEFSVDYFGRVRSFLWY